MKVTNIETFTREEWLDERRKGIGGSDVGVITGSNTYQTEWDLHQDKKFKVVREPDANQKKNMQRGNDLEDLVLQYGNEYMKSTGSSIVFRKPNYMQWSTKQNHEMLFANVDGISDCGQYLAECKVVSQYGQHGWTLGVPAYYVDQVQHYMLVTGAKKTYVFAFFLEDWELKTYEIEYDAYKAEYNAAMCIHWWNKYMKGDDTPTPTLDRADLVPMVFSDEPKYDPTADEKIREYEVLKAEIKALEGRADIMYKELLAQKGEHNILQGDTFQFKTTKRTGRTSIDATLLKLNFPEAYARSQKQNADSFTTHVKVLSKKG